MSTDKEVVINTMNKIIYKLSDMIDTPSGKATLAGLRNSIGKPLDRSVEAMELIVSKLPDDCYGRGDDLSSEEHSILIALQMFSLCMQGSKKLNIKECEENFNYKNNIGTSLRALRTGDDFKAIDRRFNAMITSNDLEELEIHLRSLIKLLKSKTENVKIDFPKLANDLYWFDKGFDESVRLDWSREYYKINYNDNKETDENKND